MAEYRPYVGPGSHLAITPTSICKWGFVLHSMAFQGWALICCPLCSPCIISVKVKVRRWRKIKLNIGSYPKQSAEWIIAWLQPGGCLCTCVPFASMAGLGVISSIWFYNTQWLLAKHMDDMNTRQKCKSSANLNNLHFPKPICQLKFILSASMHFQMLCSIKGTITKWTLEKKYIVVK